MSKKDGGPAFPVEVSWGDTAEEFGGRQTGPHSGFQTGLSLRDYFAAKALQGMLALPIDLDMPSEECLPHLSKLAYKYADAMLLAREN